MPPAGADVRDRNTQVQRVLLGLLVANLAVVGAKFVIGLRTGSLGVLGDAVHSSVDAMNNVLALAVIWVASREPDEDHPYGHEKFENLGALAIVVFLSITGFELVENAMSRLTTGAAPLHVSPVEFTVLAATLVVNTLVTVYETRRGRELNSHILLADSAHTRADVFITTGVLIGVLATGAGYRWVDSVVALVVAVVIVVLAYRIVARSVPVLVDQHVAPADEIRAVAEAVQGVISAYDIRSRGAGDRRFAELTISVPPDETVEAAHHVADAVEQRLREELAFREVVVHVEPC
ncbi:MAG: cation transporter [Gemmatimonadota bacterium]|nr:MAG: cation transporter [Gemmatimonadota bacterium]